MSNNEFYPYKSYEDWYDNGPGSEKAIREANKSLQSVGAKMWDAMWNQNHQWIKVEDGLPKVKKEVLVTDGKDIYIAHLLEINPQRKDWFFYYEAYNSVITHWMFLPDLPKK